jgi:hypothetical protein
MAADTTDRLLRTIQETLQKQSALLAMHTRKLESVELKLGRVLELVLLGPPSSEDDDEPGEKPTLDEIMAEIEKLSPEELKQQMAQAIAIIAAESEDEEDESEP